MFVTVYFSKMHNCNHKENMLNSTSINDDRQIFPLKTSMIRR